MLRVLSYRFIWLFSRHIPCSFAYFVLYNFAFHQAGLNSFNFSGFLSIQSSWINCCSWHAKAVTGEFLGFWWQECRIQIVHGPISVWDKKKNMVGALCLSLSCNFHDFIIAQCRFSTPVNTGHCALLCANCALWGLMC